MLLGHNLLVDWLELIDLFDQSLSLGGDLELLGEETLHVMEPSQGFGALLLKLASLSGAVLELSHGIVQLLLAIIELPLHLTHLALDLGLGGRVSEDLHQLVTQSHDLREQRSLVVKVLGHTSQCLQFLLSISLADGNVIKIVADLAEVVG